ncbi:MAG: porin family protein [Bacteroidota bacterium]
MKKYLFILTLFCLSHTLYAQNEYTFTVFGEPQVSWMSPDSKDVESDGSQISFNGGFNFDNFFADRYAYSTGISINNIKGKLRYKDSRDISAKDTTYSITDEVVSYNLQYIDIPLGLKFKTIEIGYSRFFAHLGLDAAINIKSSADLPGSNDVNVSNDVNWYNLGYYFGGGIEYSIGGSTALVGGITYKNGFTDITKNNSNKVTSGNVSLRLGILF